MLSFISYLKRTFSLVHYSDVFKERNFSSKTTRSSFFYLSVNIEVHCLRIGAPNLHRVASVRFEFLSNNVRISSSNGKQFPSNIEQCLLVELKFLEKMKPYHHQVTITILLVETDSNSKRFVHVYPV